MSGPTTGRGISPERPRDQAAGVLFVDIAAAPFLPDQFTTVSVASGFDGSSPLTVALSVAAVVVALVWIVTDSAFES